MARYQRKPKNQFGGGGTTSRREGPTPIFPEQPRIANPRRVHVQAPAVPSIPLANLTIQIHPAVPSQNPPAIPNQIHQTIPSQLQPTVPSQLQPTVPSQLQPTVPSQLQPTVPSQLHPTVATLTAFDSVPSTPRTPISPLDLQANSGEIHIETSHNAVDIDTNLDHANGASNTGDQITSAEEWTDAYVPWVEPPREQWADPGYMAPSKQVFDDHVAAMANLPPPSPIKPAIGTLPEPLTADTAADHAPKTKAEIPPKNGKCPLKQVPNDILLQIAALALKHEHAIYIHTTFLPDTEVEGTTTPNVALLRADPFFEIKLADAFFKANTFCINLVNFKDDFDEILHHPTAGRPLVQLPDHAPPYKWPSDGRFRWTEMCQRTYARDFIRSVILRGRDGRNWEDVAACLRGFDDLKYVCLDLRGADWKWQEEMRLVPAPKRLMEALRKGGVWIHERTAVEIGGWAGKTEDELMLTFDGIIMKIEKGVDAFAGGWMKKRGMDSMRDDWKMWCLPGFLGLQ